MYARSVVTSEQRNNDMQGSMIHMNTIVREWSTLMWKCNYQTCIRVYNCSNICIHVYDTEAEGGRLTEATVLKEMLRVPSVDAAGLSVQLSGSQPCSQAARSVCWRPLEAYAVTPAQPASPARLGKCQGHAPRWRPKPQMDKLNTSYVQAPTTVLLYHTQYTS